MREPSGEGEHVHELEKMGGLKMFSMLMIDVWKLEIAPSNAHSGGAHMLEHIGPMCLTRCQLVLELYYSGAASLDSSHTSLLIRCRRAPVSNWRLSPIEPIGATRKSWLLVEALG